VIRLAEAKQEHSDVAENMQSRHYAQRTHHTTRVKAPPHVWCVWFYGCDTWRVIPGTPSFFCVMHLRELCSTCDWVLANFVSKVVLRRALICPIECLEQPFAKIVEDWSFGTRYDTIVNVCTNSGRMQCPSIATFHILFSNPTV